MLKLYLAGRIAGLSYEEAMAWREKVAKELAGDFEIISPMRGKSYLSKEEAIKASYPNTICSGSKAIYQRDRFDVLRCDIVLANLEHGFACGTLVEIGMADAWNKLIILIAPRPETHPFLAEKAIQVSSVEAAISLLKVMKS